MIIIIICILQPFNYMQQSLGNDKIIDNIESEMINKYCSIINNHKCLWKTN